MSFDPLVANAGRLQILTALAVEHTQDFVQLRQATRLTDGNLASHARRLRSAGLIAIDKQFREGKPVTSFTLTPEGRTALEAHTRRLVAAISHRRFTPAGVVFTPAGAAPSAPKPRMLAVATPLPAPEEDWVD
jgi:DNA-binding MarR family transcriptional regulator